MDIAMVGLRVAYGFVDGDIQYNFYSWADKMTIQTTYFSQKIRCDSKIDLSVGGIRTIVDLLVDLVTPQKSP